MLTSEKAAAFDTLCEALTNRWYDRRWSWFPLTPCGGVMCDTREEAVEDLVKWSKRMAELNRKRFAK